YKNNYYKNNIKMDLSKNNSSIRRAIKYIEWTRLFVYFVFVILNSDESNYLSQKIPFYGSLIYLSIMGILSFIFPINGSNLQKKIYVYLEIFLTVFLKSLGSDLEILLYLVLVKSCFLLSRKQVICIVIMSGILWNIALFVSAPSLIEFRLNNISQFINKLNDTNRIIAVAMISETVVYLAASTFVVLLSFVIISEQKSRQKAEFLSQKVETLAANLERTRIAREIHDSLGHYLTSLDVQLELAQRLYQQDIVQAAESVDIAKDLASECLSQVRRSVQTMRQSNFNLNEALKLLIETTQKNQNFSIQANLNLPILPVQTSHQIYCIIQEGLTNIQKHANASLITLTGKQQENGILVELIDNGQGFDIALHNTGFGLRGMHERANILGADLKVYSTIGEGTKIQIWVLV
ncbi:MAG: sensor histidine kinase, partial [Cyanobacteria bacterium P01_A01_bin.84]